ncbi:MAG: hypothetical protein V7K38_02860 [Nostoc sp.]
MVEKNALLELTNPDYPGHQMVLEHQQSDLSLHQETLLNRQKFHYRNS